MFDSDLNEAEHDISGNSNLDYKIYRVQHIILLSVIIFFLIIFSIHLYFNQLRIDHGLIINQASVVETEFKINPNTASWETIALLPGIGPAKAQAIVQFRDDYIKNTHINDGDNMNCFCKPSDLEKVKGIGPIIIDLVKNNLVFD